LPNHFPGSPLPPEAPAPHRTASQAHHPQLASLGRRRETTSTQHLGPIHKPRRRPKSQVPDLLQSGHQQRPLLTVNHSNCCVSSISATSIVRIGGGFFRFKHLLASVLKTGLSSIQPTTRTAQAERTTGRLNFELSSRYYKD
jgi:hypothetical protein